MPVYFIRAGEHGPVKIGYSEDPDFRLGQLQISHWETLRIIRLFEGGEAEEAALHDRFADQFIRGEWHHFTRAMLGDVGFVEIIRDAPRAPVWADCADGPKKMREHLTNNSIPVLVFANAIGVTAQAMHRYITGQRIPRAEVLERIVSETAGKVQPNDFFSFAGKDTP